MSRDECVTFKVFLKNNEVTEVKKLMVDGNNASVTNVSFITEMLQSAFPILLDVNFWITWRDRHGDDILIEKDEDLIRALTEMDGSVKTLYLIASPGNKSGNAPQFTNPPTRILCGVCNKEITNFRYTCLQCYDYDHCIECEYSGHHSQHEMMRTSLVQLPLNKREFKKGCNPCDFSGSKKNVPDQGSSFQEHAPRLYPLINAGSLAANATSTAASAVAATTEASSPLQPPKPSKQTISSPRSEEEQSSDEESFFQEYMPLYDHSINAATSQAGTTAVSMASNPIATRTVAETEASAPFEEPKSPTQTKSTSRLNKERNASYQFTKADTNAPSNVEIAPEKTSALNIAIGLRRLVEMGFQDEEALVVLLKRYNGNVNEVARDILENDDA